MSPKPKGTKPSVLERRAAVEALLTDRKDLLIVTGLGSPSYDVFAAGDHPGNYYLWAAMGSATTVGFGIAMAQRERPVLVLTGDGEMLMGIGSLATVALKAPKNLTIAVLDNGHYGETGMQLSHTGRGVELDQVAASFTLPWTRRVTDMAGLDELRLRVHAQAGLSFATIKITAENPPRALPPRDGVAVKTRFRTNLGFGTI
jgi:thiamine pyrophosphate-dependent acetolactate synthase large subunit-like protein